MLVWFSALCIPLYYSFFIVFSPSSAPQIQSSCRKNNLSTKKVKYLLSHYWLNLRSNGRRVNGHKLKKVHKIYWKYNQEMCTTGSTSQILKRSKQNPNNQPEKPQNKREQNKSKITKKTQPIHMLSYPYFCTSIDCHCFFNTFHFLITYLEKVWRESFIT